MLNGRYISFDRQELKNKKTHNHRIIENTLAGLLKDFEPCGNTELAIWANLNYILLDIGEYFQGLVSDFVSNLDILCPVAIGNRAFSFERGD